MHNLLKIEILKEWTGYSKLLCRGLVGTTKYWFNPPKDALWPNIKTYQITLPNYSGIYFSMERLLLHPT